MDGAKSKYIAASEVYAAIDSGNTSLCVDARRAGFRCRCPARHITAWHPASRSRTALRHRRVASVSRAVRDCQPSSRAGRMSLSSRSPIITACDGLQPD